MTRNDRLFPWLTENWTFLQSYIRQNRVPHGLLISGSDGIGKTTLAQEFAHSLLCNQPVADSFSCGFCHSCQLVKANTHPDLWLIEANDEKTAISILQIRKLITDSYLKPQYDKFRVVIIKAADKMTIQAANAFLKCLEEPTERTIFILLAEKPSHLPATIVSRCQHITIVSPEKDVLNSYLKTQGISGDQKTFANLINAAIASIDQLTDDTYLKQRLDCFNDWQAIAMRKSHPALISEKWQQIPQIQLINWLISWVTDLIKCSSVGDYATICNLDLLKPLQDLSQQLELKRLFKFYELLLNSKDQHHSQINLQLMMDDILIQWSDLNRRIDK